MPATITPQHNTPLLLVVLVGLLSTLIVSVEGQATRTWISGVGDDANPCSRSAPCKTWAGALSKTLARGEISVMDPGGFGTAAITKSILLDGGGFIASSLSVSQNGFIISVPANETVVLRNLQINGAGNGIAGIKFLSGTLFVENVDITGIQQGILLTPTSTEPMKVLLTNTRIQRYTDAGIVVGANGADASNLQLSLDRVTMGQGQNGIVLNSGKVNVMNSVIGQHEGNGLYVNGSSELNVLKSQVVDNAVGLAVGSSGTVRLMDSEFLSNAVDMTCDSTLASYSRVTLSQGPDALPPASCAMVSQASPSSASSLSSWLALL